MPEARDVLMGGGLPSVKLNKPGDRFDGTIVSIGEPFQSRDYVTGDPKWWDKEKTQKVYTVCVECESDVDGKTYGLYIEQSTDLQRVTATAVRTAGARDQEVGGHWSVAVTDMEEVIKNGKKLNDKKLHGAVYTLPPSRAQQVLSAPEPATVSQPAQQAVQVDLTRPPQSQPEAAVPSVPSVPATATPAMPALESLPPEMQELMRQLMNSPQAGK
jgi:hypothetical protein